MALRRSTSSCVVDACAVAAFVLGAVERDVGPAHDIGGLAGTAVDHRDADAGADQQRMAVDRIGRVQHVDQTGGETLDRGVVRRLAGDDGELVAAEPCHEIFMAHGVDEALRDDADQPVADVMAERVVDVLEMVEVDRQDGRMRVIAMGFGEHGGKTFAEIGAVG
jgi:hypothetical protein